MFNTKNILAVITVIGTVLLGGSGQALAVAVSIIQIDEMIVTENQTQAIDEVGVLVDDNKGGSASGIDGALGVDVLGDYAYVSSATDDALSIIDISDPTNPVEVATLKDGVNATELDGAWKVRVVGDYAYVTGAFDDAFSIIDVSDPTNPVEVATLKDGVNATELNYARSLEVLGDYAYVTAYHDDALAIIDISSSTNPVEVGTIKRGVGATKLDGANDIVVVGDYAYITSRFDDAFSIINISSSTNPVEVGVIVDDSSGGTASMIDVPYTVDVRGDYAYVGGIIETSFSIFNISDPANIVEVSAIDFGEGPSEIILVGDYIYSIYYGTLSIYDVSDVNNPTEVITIQDEVDTQELEGDGHLYARGGYLYAAALVDDALSIFSLSGKSNFYTITLDEAPTDNVTISISSSDTDTGVTVSPSTITFTPDDWHRAQHVSVTAVDDYSYEGNHSATITHTATSDDADYNGLSISDVVVSIADNDPRPSPPVSISSGSSRSSTDDTDDTDTDEETVEDEEGDTQDGEETTEKQREEFQRQINEIREVIQQLINLIQIKFGIQIDVDF